MASAELPEASRDHDEPASTADETIQVGILTEGKATLAMVLVGLVLQESVPLDIYIVDTAASAVIKRDDVVFAMRLAFDRGVHCGYERIKERNRRFSVGRLRLLDELTGPLISFMDDDIVLAPSAVRSMYSWARDAGQFGFVSPVLKNWGGDSAAPGRPQYSPGGIIYQDAIARRLLREYYDTTTDILDARGGPERFWEKAFLSELFPSLGRQCEVRQDCLGYHLDYRERPVRYELDDRIIQASAAHARALAATVRTSTA
ncbi:MAG: glycosyltransferase family 2 protein [Chloroflexi bacterium]|nr:glycosyltransferase family 2 protein [Chloroflexota bacterium]